MFFYDVVIVGGGITGLALARNLSQYQLKVAIIEKEPDIAMGATKANSAIVHGGYAEHHETLKGQLCYLGRRQFNALNNDLHFGFKSIGSLVMTTYEKALPKLKSLLENGIKNGLTDLSIIDREKILSIEPNINSNVKYALYCKGAGICSPYGMAIALAENAVMNDVKLFLNQEITHISKVSDDGSADESIYIKSNSESTHVNAESDLDTAISNKARRTSSDKVRFLIHTKDKVYRSRYVVNCAGLQADKISAMLYPPDFNLHARTGEYLVFQRGSGNLIKHVIFQMPTHMGKGILVTPTVHDNLIIGPDAIDSAGPPDRSTHVARLVSIFREALQTSNKIDPNKMIRSFSGARSVSSSNDFIIRMSPVNGFIEAVGIQSPGLTASPAIADKIVAILEKSGLVLEKKTNFIAKRKPLPEVKKFRPMSEIAQLVESASDCERIICRCEQISQMMISDVAARGLPVLTIDAVKRRTRAGMGICQGSFCGSRVAAILASMGINMIDSMTDVQRLGLNRVDKNAFIKHLNETTP